MKHDARGYVNKEGKSVKEIYHSLSISKPTFYRYVRNA